MNKNTILEIPRYGVWSERFYEEWQHSMVTGNGEQGAMMFSDPVLDTIILNNEDLFLPLGSNEDLPNLAPYLEELREILKKRNYTEGLEFINQKSSEQGHKYIKTDPFHPGAFLHIETQERDFTEYMRTENFLNGEIGMTYKCDDDQHVRKMFASRADHVIAFKMYNIKHPFSCEVWAEDISNELIISQKETSEDWITFVNHYIYKETGYDVAIKLITDGKTILSGDKICIQDASDLTMIMKVSFFYGQSKSDEIRRFVDGISFDYEELLERHQKIHGELFLRTSLNICNEKEYNKSFEALMDMVQNGEIPVALHQKNYEMSKYMVISSFGKYPANLQGIWTGTWEPMWSGDYTINTNVQLAIEGLLSCGYYDLLGSFFDLVEAYQDDYRENAKMLFGARGMLSPNRISNTGKSLHYGIESKFAGMFWTCGLGWLCHWYFKHYTYTGDISILKERGLHLMKETALFYEDFLIEDENGKLRFTPSFSAENGMIEGVFTTDCMTDNSTQDIAVAREVLSNLIHTCELIDDHDENIHTWEMLLEKLPDYVINSDGVLQEWAVEGAEERPNHRHFSQLYSVFESLEFDPDETPELWNASIKSFEERLNKWFRSKNTVGPSSHGKAHLALSAVRLGFGDVVDEVLTAMIQNNTYFESLITSNFGGLKIFNVDMNGAMSRIVNDAIVYARKNIIYLLSALPNWKEGTAKNIRLDGEMLVEKLAWDDYGDKVSLEISSKKDMDILILYRRKEYKRKFERGIVYFEYTK